MSYLITRSCSSSLLSADSSTEPHKRPYIPPSPPMSQHRAAEDEAATLQKENQALKSRLRYLQHHLSLSKMHTRYSIGAQRNRRMDPQHFRLLGERRRALVASHFSSVRGSHAREYQTLLMKHTYLEDQFRQITAARIVARYRLQKLVIDAARSYKVSSLLPLSPSTNPVPSTHSKSF